MSLVKVVRNGQVTIPKQIREKLGIKEGDILEVEPIETGVLFKPKEVVDRGDALQAFSRGLERLRSGFSDKLRNMDDAEIDTLIEEAIQAIRKGKSVKRTKAVGR